MKHRKTAFFALAVSLILATAGSSLPVAAQSPSPVADTAADEAQLHALDGEITSIAERIPQVERMLAQAEAKRDETNREIAKVSAETSRLLPELKSKAIEADRADRLFAEALDSDYRSAKPDAVELLASSDSVGQALARLKYAVVLRSKLDVVAREAEQASEAVQDRKTALDGKKSTLELLQRQVTELERGIREQRHDLQELLANRSNEAAYLQTKIAQAKEARDRLLAEAGGNAIWGTFTEGAQVKQGDTIGFEGSTGFSTGCHTHFSVIKDGRWHNPEAFWTSLRHPDGSMVQPYGWTAWAKQGVYHGDIHNGIDFVQGCGKPVRAAADGTVIRDIRNDASGFGHYVMIRHADGLITLYAHLI